MRVLEATTTWAGPMCACILGDFGADVIKVELPEGEVARRLPPFLPDAPDGAAALSFMHTTVNRNKRSLTLDLRRAEGAALFLRLARRADVVVENFRPGTVDAWGIGYEQVRAVRPDVVYVSIRGFGQFGPDRERAGYDPMAQAASGWLSLNGEPGGAPVKAPTFLGDDLGGLHGALGAMAALRHRDRTGEGQHVDVALQDALLFQSNGYPMLAALGVDLPRMGSQFVVAAPAGVYRCSDDYVMLGVLTDAHWRVLAGLLGRPELADHPDYATGSKRIGRRAELNALVEAWVATRTVAEVVETLVAARLPGLRRAPLRRLRARSRTCSSATCSSPSSSRTASARRWSAPRRSSRARRCARAHGRARARRAHRRVARGARHRRRGARRAAGARSDLGDAADRARRRPLARPRRVRASRRADRYGARRGTAHSR